MMNDYVVQVLHQQYTERARGRRQFGKAVRARRTWRRRR
jgi:hypothetical protein